MKINKHYWARYIKFIMARINRPKPDCYTEKHHIWPRCLGGLKGQCVDLTDREHFIAHWILSKCFEDKYCKIKMVYAFTAMSCSGQLSGKQIAKANDAKILYGEDNPFFGKRHTEESKQKMCRPRGKYPERSAEHNAKIGDALRGRKQLIENIAKTRISRLKNCLDKNISWQGKNELNI